MKHPPIKISILIHYYAMDGDYPDTINHQSRPYWRELISDGLLFNPHSSEDRVYQLTGRGRKFVQMILETPLPEQEWVDPRRPLIMPVPVETTQGDLTVLDKPAFLRRIVD